MKGKIMLLDNIKKIIPRILKKRIKEITQKIKIFLNPNPKSYKDIVKNYEKYIFLQTKKYLSHELDNEHCKEGQKRYIKKEFVDIDREAFIIDIACGDGVGLSVFKEMGFKNVVGVELSDEKLSKALSYGYKVIKADMHNLEMFNENQYDVIYSSHTLEHAYNPIVVLNEFYRLLKNDGLLKVVLPYPDITRKNDEAHGGKYELKTNIDDNAESTIKVFEAIGFKLIDKKYDSYREPEIWLTFKK